MDKLTDAKKAGGAHARQCVLIITEGDSAKTSALSGIAALSDAARECYGVMAIKGKILNVRKSEQKAVNKNDEINNLISAWGLDYNRTYENEADLNTLRYGKLMIMADQDDDGFHIKGLLLNFIQFYWPALIERVYQFKTPLIKARQKGKTVEFYTEAEFGAWAKEKDLNKWRIKHYKGLGTSTADEFRAYFRQMTNHTQQFTTDSQSSALDDAFSRDEIDTRKQFILNYKVDDDDNYVDESNLINVDDFVQYQLGNYFLSSATRAIPSVVDGLKDVQRKILWVCLNRRSNEEIKVAQLAGAVAQKAAYHHGENSIQGAIVTMARSIVGTRPGANINLLEPIGQFGSRLEGGKDCAAPRYIFTRLSPIAKQLFSSADEAVYSYTSDDGKQREPDYYAPVIPMVLVNGSYGLGVGFATNIPAHCPIALVDNIRAMIDGREEAVTPILEPWYRGFKGEIRTNDRRNAFASYGNVEVIKKTKKEIHARINELPLGTWTQDYVERLKKWKGDDLIKDFNDLSDDINVNITVKLAKTKKDVDLVNYLKLKKSHNYANGLVCLNHRGRVTVYESTLDIMKDYFDVRQRLYQKRYDALLVEKQARVDFTSNQLRFLNEKRQFESKSKAEVIQMFRQAGYQTNPVNAKDDFDYLLNMPFYYQTTEKNSELVDRERNQMRDYDEHRLRRTAADLWKSDLDSLLLKLVK